MNSHGCSSKVVHASSLPPCPHIFIMSSRSNYLGVCITLFVWHTISGQLTRASKCQPIGCAITSLSDISVSAALPCVTLRCRRCVMQASESVRLWLCLHTYTGEVGSVVFPDAVQSFSFIYIYIRSHFAQSLLGSVTRLPKMGKIPSLSLFQKMPVWADSPMNHIFWMPQTALILLPRTSPPSKHVKVSSKLLFQFWENKLTFHWRENKKPKAIWLIIRYKDTQHVGILRIKYYKRANETFVQLCRVNSGLIVWLYKATFSLSDLA